MRSDGRQLLEDLGLLVLRQVFQDVDGVIGIEFAHALGDGFRRQLVEDFLADGVVDLGQRGEVEIRAHQRDQARAQFRIERLDDGAGVGLVQLADQLAQRGAVAASERLDDARRHNPRADALVVARRNGGRRRGQFLSPRACRSFMAGPGGYDLRFLRRAFTRQSAGNVATGHGARIYRSCGLSGLSCGTYARYSVGPLSSGTSLRAVDWGGDTDACEVLRYTACWHRKSVAAMASECPGNPAHRAPAAPSWSIRPSTSAGRPFQYRETLPLNDKEVVLTFDDGPLPTYTEKSSTSWRQCVKATFFLVGRMASAFPKVVRRIHDEGHTSATTARAIRSISTP